MLFLLLFETIAKSEKSKFSLEFVLICELCRCFVFLLVGLIFLFLVIFDVLNYVVLVVCGVDVKLKQQVTVVVIFVNVLVCFYSSHMNCLKQWNLFSNLTPHRLLHSNYF